MKAYTENFNDSHTFFLLNRLHVISISLLALYAFYFYVDLVLYKSVAGTPFHTTLILIHAAGFLASLFYMGIYPLVKKNRRFLQSFGPALLLDFYVLLYIGSSALGSLNSYRLSGNIDFYLVVLVAIAILLPIQPKHFFCILTSTHTFFLIMLASFIDDPNLLASKQIISTISVFVSFLVLLLLYSSKEKDFQHHQKQDELHENFRTLFELNPYPLFLSRLSDGKLLLLNRAAAESCPPCQASDSLTDHQLVFSNPQERHKLVDELRARGSIKNYILRQDQPLGTTRWGMAHYELILYGSETCILSGVTDITPLKKIEENLVEHANYDALTGTLNRRSGMEALNNWLSGSRQEASSCIVCFIDLNHLKQVNDRYGHQAGDEMIKDFCAVIREHLPAEDLFFRYGGDEFIILFFQKDWQETTSIWASIQLAFAERNSSGGKPYILSASHGLFRCETGTDLSSEEIIQRADQEMYKDKQGQRLSST